VAHAVEPVVAEFIAKEEQKPGPPRKTNGEDGEAVQVAENLKLQRFGEKFRSNVAEALGDAGGSIRDLINFAMHDRARNGFGGQQKAKGRNREVNQVREAALAECEKSTENSRAEYHQREEEKGQRGSRCKEGIKPAGFESPLEDWETLIVTDGLVRYLRRAKKQYCGPEEVYFEACAAPAASLRIIASRRPACARRSSTSAPAISW